MEDLLNIHYGAVHHKINRRFPFIKYKVKNLETPRNILSYDSSWRGIESIIADLISQFNIPTQACLEFGTEFGYSIVALANYFDKVTGVDTFTGDVQAGLHVDNYREMVEKLKPWANINLVQSDYRNYINLPENDKQYGLIHVDILHDFKETYECGLWAVNHSKCAIFHDSESYPEVKKACYHLALDTGKQFYNYEKFFGLGIIV